MASGGVWKTTNAGTTWEPIFDDHPATVGDLAVARWNHDVVWVGTGERNSLRSNSWGDGLYKSTDGGRNWSHMGLTETREIGRIAIHPTDSSVVYVAALGHLWGPNPERGVYKTTDGGESWERVLFVDDTTGFVDLKMDPSNPDVLYA
ncbi:MAG: glycosyl hydrolase, partial [Actinobacteria bacterium]|nr:glycosyl hydrolase [Actinomycetota bacterium]NIV56275.1 glycosyl hydrolase [Actinomycetota bacterium]NIX51108.1 glycosyl hydrolase [Actinomycetota bacterium]